MTSFVMKDEDLGFCCTFVPSHMTQVTMYIAKVTSKIPLNLLLKILVWKIAVWGHFLRIYFYH